MKSAIFVKLERKLGQEPEEMIPRDTEAYCIDEKCGWIGTVGSCDIDNNSEGWEYPNYEALICPQCGEYVEY